MLERMLSRFITTQGAKLDLDEESLAVANYGLQVIVYSAIGVVLLIIIGHILGILAVTFAAFATGALLRTFSGGAHCKSAVKCMSITCTIYPLLALISVNIYSFATAYFYYITAVIFIYAIYSLYKLGPVDCEEKPVTCSLHRKQLRVISFSLIAVFLILSVVAFQYGYYKLVLAGQLGILWQSMTLWPTSVKIARKYDKLGVKK